MLLNREAVGIAIEVLGEDPADMFYVEAHRFIYAAAVGLYRRNAPVDELTLFQQLAADGHANDFGGASYLAELTGSVPTSANVEYYAKFVLDTAILRKLIQSCSQIVGAAYEHLGEAGELLDNAESAIFSIAQSREVNPIAKVGELITDAVERIQALIDSHTGISGLPTGYDRLDKMLSGLQPSDMVVLAARPSIGKTALALNIARHAAIDNGKGVLMFSLEMSKEQLTQRLLCMEGRINSAWLREGFQARDSMEKVTAAAGRVYPAPIYIDDTANVTMLEIRSKARRLIAQHDVSLIIIDYLQLMSGSSGSRRAENRQVEISEISRGIKVLARELHVPVLALSQLSREAERDDKGVPKLSHLRESGSIEQDADVVLMLYKPPAHRRQSEGDEPGDENLIKLSIAKQRNGPTGTIDLLFLRDMQRFENPVEGPIAEDAAMTGTYPGDDDYDDYGGEEDYGGDED
ncbi:MAG: replicative DNA helicase [Nitrospiraceae bacterium]|nr:replicative DNA helicase [Nitrospiraceae bacterium]